MKGKNAKNDRSPQKTNILEIIAYVQLRKETLRTCWILKDNAYCAAYKSIFIEGRRLIIYDHREEIVASVKRYLMNGFYPVLSTNMRPARISVMKKNPGMYYINIFPASKKERLTTTLREDVIINPSGKGFFVSGDPLWSAIGCMDNKRLSYISLDDFMDLSRSLRYEII